MAGKGFRVLTVGNEEPGLWCQDRPSVLGLDLLQAGVKIKTGTPPCEPAWAAASCITGPVPA